MMPRIMRRSICLIEPSHARAGNVATWKFQYTTSFAIAKGAKIKFDIQSFGRDIDWEVPSVNLKEGRNLIYLLMDKGEVVPAKEIEKPDSIVPQYQFILPSPIKVGGKFTIVMGAPAKSLGDETEEEEKGNGAQVTIQRRRPFLLYIDPKGKGEFEEPEMFTLDIRGNTLDSIRILAPSFVAKNKRFDITLRFEDEYGNLTNYAQPETLIELSYEHLRENLNWKLFVPETGFVVLPNLYFNEAGTYRIQLKNNKEKKTFISSPIKCFQENDKHLYWGLFHGESERVDSTENIESCLRHFRDEKAFNFFGTSGFESVEETPNDIWKLVSQHVQEFNEEDRFVTFLGFQFQGQTGSEGIRQLVYSKDAKPILRKKEAKSSSIGKIYKIVTPKDLISIPSFTMAKGYHYDFKEFNPEFERVVEIYNAWGSSERTKKEGNTRPITGGIEETEAGSIVNALKKNHRFGFVASGLDDRGIYTPFFESDQVQYSPGMTGVIAKSYNREGIFDALQRRACFATTGEKIIVGFYIAGHMMGSELSTALKPGLALNRHISGYVAGTTNIKEIEIIRNGVVIKKFHPTSYSYDFYHDDMDPLDEITLTNGAHPFVFYYLRVTQADDHMAWSSPIWVDHVTDSSKTKK